MMALSVMQPKPVTSPEDAECRKQNRKEERWTTRS